MKRILCFGDSNTYGHDPMDGTHRLEGRWTRFLAEMLGSGYEIIEEGLCGRTSVFEACPHDMCSGLNTFEPIIKSQTPLDLIIIMLGTNDLQLQFEQDASGSAKGVEALVKVTRNIDYGKNTPEILVVSPILIDSSIKDSMFAEIYGTSRPVELSKKLAPEMEAMAKSNGTHFMDASKYAVASAIDGVHMDSANHKKLADAFAEKIREILN